MDSYKFTKNQPVRYRNLRDDVAEVLDFCLGNGYNYYQYGGMVLQIEPSHYRRGTTRWFISFDLYNDGYQRFHEASSGTGMVFKTEDNPHAFKLFMEALQNGELQ